MNLRLTFLVALLLLAGCAAKRPAVAHYEVVSECWRAHQLVCAGEHYTHCKFVPPLPPECQLVVTYRKAEILNDPAK